MLIFCLYQGKYNLLPSSQFHHAQLGAFNSRARQIASLPALPGIAFYRNVTCRTGQMQGNKRNRYWTAWCLAKKVSFPPTDTSVTISSGTGYTWLSHLLVCLHSLQTHIQQYFYHQVFPWDGKEEAFCHGNAPVSSRWHHRRFTLFVLSHPIFKTRGSCSAAMLLFLWEILSASLN